MRNLACILTLWVLLPPSAVPATTTDQQLRVFATCAGRLSAVLEYQWMFDGASADRTMAQRATVLQLVTAVMGPDQGRDVLRWRIDAKFAHQALLNRATFNRDRRDAAWAADTATRLAAECTDMLLG